MALFSDLEQQGVTAMRMTTWNPHAWIEIRDNGPWAYLHDVLTDDPVPVLKSQCDLHDDWEPRE